MKKLILSLFLTVLMVEIFAQSDEQTRMDDFYLLLSAKSRKYFFCNCNSL